MDKVKTATGKEFDCDYFNPFPPTGEVNIRILNASFVDVAAVFSNKNETAQMWCGIQYIAHHTKLMALVDDGDAIRVVLGKE